MDDQPRSGEQAPSPEPGDLAVGQDCRESLTELYGYLDGELTAERRSLIRAHIDACDGCLEAFDFEAELRQVVSSCCQEKQLPTGLKERVARALQEMEDG
ncbi:MAG: mycothiol system anti-sigma-R factor [Acidimicrobiales bacterium]|jgi:mycothiol system anti-sigma-R factor